MVTNIDKVTYVHVRRYVTEPDYEYEVTTRTGGVMRELTIPIDKKTYEVVNRKLIPTGGLTLAIDMHTIEMIGVPMRRVAIARCRRDEHYNKKIGRDVALSKLYRRVYHLSITDYTERVTIERVEDSKYPGSYVYMPVDGNGQIDITKLIQYVRTHHMYERNL